MIQESLPTQVKTVKAQNFNYVSDGPVMKTAGTEIKIEIILIGDLLGSIISGDGNIGIAYLVNEVKACKAANPNTIFVAGGDLFQGTAESNLLYGQPIVECLKEAGLVATAIGNHEFEWGENRFSGWEKDGGFVFLGANVYDRITQKMVSYAKPYLIMNLSGIKVALIGLATPETAYKTNLENVKNLEFKNPVEILPHYIKEVRAQGADLVIALTHLGAHQEESGEISGEAAGLVNMEGLDGITAAHTCESIVGNIGGIPLVMANCNGHCLGKLTYTFESNSSKLLSAQVSLDNLELRRETLCEDETCKAIINKHLGQIQSILSETIGESQVDLDHDTRIPSVLGEWVCEVIRQETGTRIAFQNGGALRAWPRGKLTVGSINSIVPFDNTLITCKLTGAQIKEAIENGLINPDVGYFGQTAGVYVVYDLTKPFGERVLKITLPDGSPVEMAESYSIVTNDFIFYGGDKYDVFAGAKDVRKTGISLREALIRHIRAQKVIAPVYKGYQVPVSEKVMV